MYSPGAKLKAELALIDKSQMWLLDQLAGVGIKLDKYTLSKMIRGVYKSPKAELVLSTSEQIIEEYRKRGREKSG